MQTATRSTVGARKAATKQPPPLTAEQLAAQEFARTEVDRTLRQLGLHTKPHADPDRDIDRSLWIDCRRESADNDHKLVYAVLEEQGWNPDPARLSRYRGHYDVVRLKHRATRATLVVIVKVPFADPLPAEAA